MSYPFDISLVISTYNWPEALALVLKSAIHQKTNCHYEIIIADDGSRVATQSLVTNLTNTSPIDIQYIWQEDLGFRLAKSRNNAIKIARGNYLVFVDGDTILHPKFVDDHYYHAQKNRLVVGSRVLLKDVATQRILKQQNFKFNFLTAANNKQNGFYNRYLSNLTKKDSNTPIEQLIFKIRGCNMACFLQDIIEVNGFNEDFEGWGREDSEFALRLFNKGLALKQIKFNAIQYHLYHPENNKNELLKNNALLDSLQKSKIYQCKNGLKALT